MKTLKEKIAVMQAALDGKEIDQSRKAYADGEWIRCYDPKTLNFNWEKYDYRIKPKPLECWVNTYDGNISQGYDTENDARAVKINHVQRTVKMREVIEND